MDRNGAVKAPGLAAFLLLLSTPALAWPPWADHPPRPPDQTIPDGAIQKCDDLPPLLLGVDLIANGEHGDFHAHDLEIRNHRLFMMVDYAEGCGAHEFLLCYAGVPQGRGHALSLTLFDRTTNRCEAGVETWFIFDLAKLRHDLRRAKRTKVRLDVAGTASVWYVVR
jgi:hypothetical protein